MFQRTLSLPILDAFSHKAFLYQSYCAGMLIRDLVRVAGKSLDLSAVVVNGKPLRYWDGLGMMHATQWEMMGEAVCGMHSHNLCSGDDHSTQQVQAATGSEEVDDLAHGIRLILGLIRTYFRCFLGLMWTDGWGMDRRDGHGRTRWMDGVDVGGWGGQTGWCGRTGGTWTDGHRA